MTIGDPEDPTARPASRPGDPSAEGDVAPGAAPRSSAHRKG